VCRESVSACIETECWLKDRIRSTILGFQEQGTNWRSKKANIYIYKQYIAVFVKAFDLTYSILIPILINSALVEKKTTAKPFAIVHTTKRP
jgi:hypothetical protein